MADLQVRNGKIVYLDENGNEVYALPTQSGIPGQAVVYDEDGNLTAGVGLSTLGSLSNVDSNSDSAAVGQVLSFNGVYWEAVDLSVGGVVFDSAYVQARQSYNYDQLINTPVVFDSGNIQSIVDANYVTSLGVVGTDSTAVVDIIAEVVNNLYVRNRQDYAYTSLTGAPTTVSAFSNDAGYLTSATVTGVIDTNYIRANQSTFADSAYVALQISNLVDGAPIALDTLNELATALQNDSDALAALVTVVDTKLNTSQVTSLVDSSYVQARQDYSYESLVNLPDFFDSTDATILATLLVDSSYVQTRQDYSYGSLIDLPDYFDSTDATILATLLVDSSYVQARQDYQYSSLVDLPDFFDSTDATLLTTSLVDSSYVQSRQDYSYGSLIDLPDFFDSTDATILVNTAYVQARQDYQYSSLVNLPDFFDSADAIVLIDSDYVQARQDNHNLTSDVTNTTVDANFIPAVDDTYTLGSSTNKFSTIFGAMPVYDSIGLLPNPGLPGEMAFVPSASRVYVSTGAGWFKLLIDNAAPSIASITDSNGDPGPFVLSVNQQPTIITVEAIDSDGDALTFNYATDSVFDTFASISQNANVFTVTPFSVDSAPAAGTGSVTFSVTDGLDADASEQTFTIDFRPDWSSVSLQQRIVASDYVNGSLDYFGDKVAISGDTVVVGAWQTDDGGSASGSAYVFTRSGSSWSQQQKIEASDRASNDYFGRFVAIDGDIIVVGATNEDDGGAEAGAAYVFTRSGTTWTQQQKLTASDAQAGDYFGITVGLSGNIIVVGAEGEDGAATDYGAAYVFTTSDGGSTWTEQQKLVASDPQGSAQFGDCVAIDGNTIAVGAAGAGGAAGAVYVFTTSDGGSTWTQQQKLTASDAQAVDVFGQSVAIDGDTIVVGANGEDTPGSGAGATYVFTRSGTTWTEQQKIQSSDIQAGDYFGISVDILNEAIIVGASFEDTGGSNAGAAYIFTRSGTTWTQQAKIQATIPTADDQYGYAVAIGIDTAIVGARYDDEGAISDNGAVYIYTAPFS